MKHGYRKKLGWFERYVIVFAFVFFALLCIAGSYKALMVDGNNVCHQQAKFSVGLHTVSIQEYQAGGITVGGAATFTDTVTASGPMTAPAFYLEDGSEVGAATTLGGLTNVTDTASNAGELLAYSSVAGGWYNTDVLYVDAITAAKNVTVNSDAGANDFVVNRVNSGTAIKYDGALDQLTGDFVHITATHVRAGVGAGENITTASDIVAIGNYAYRFGTDGNYTVAIGSNSCYYVNGNNTGVGHKSIQGNIGATATSNTGLGRESLFNVEGATGNSAIGYRSGYNITHGNYNLSLCYESGSDVTTGSRGISLGRDAAKGRTTEDGCLFIDGYGDSRSDFADSQANAIIFGQMTAAGASNQTLTLNAEVTATSGLNTTFVDASGEVTATGANVGLVNYDNATGLTVTNGYITVSQSYHSLTGDATCTQIAGGKEGDYLFLSHTEGSGNKVVFSEDGNIRYSVAYLHVGTADGGTYFYGSTNEVVGFVREATYWRHMYSSNGLIPGSSTSLANLGDVSISSPTEGQVLGWDSVGAAWENTTVSAGAEISDTAYNGTDWASSSAGASMSAIQSALNKGLMRATTVSTVELTLTTADSGKTLSNYGATTDVTFNLPANAEGLIFRLLNEVGDQGQDADCMLLAPCDASPVVCIEQGTVFTLTNNADITTTKKFGDGAVAFDGTDDDMYSADSDLWDIPAGAATIDFWVYFNAINANNALIAHGGGGNDATDYNGWNVKYQGGATQKLYFGGRLSGAPASADWAWPTPDRWTWYHVAIVRDADGDMRAYIDGTEIDTAVSRGDAFNEGAHPLRIGESEDGTQDFNGVIDEIRISRGIARWSANFTPPTQAYYSAAVYVNPDGTDKIIGPTDSGGDKLESNDEGDVIILRNTSRGWFVDSMYPDGNWTDAD